jgi:hypothetical protein
MLAEIV